MRIALYVVKDRIIIPTVARAGVGFREVEPVASLRLGDPNLPQVLEEALRRGNPHVESPSRMNFPEAVVVKYAGAESWPAFVKIAERWEFVAEDGTYTLAHGTKDSKGNYWGGKNKLMIPRDASGTLPDTIAIVDAIRSDAKAR